LNPPPTSTTPAALADPAFAELIEATRAGTLVICAGPAISIAADLPSRSRLITLLLERARARGVAPAVRKEVEDLVQRGQLLDALGALKTALGEAEFGALVQRQLDDRDRPIPAIAAALAALAPKLRAVLTTNLDHLLERAFAGAFPAFPRATTDLAQQRGYLLKLHGSLLDRSTWVLTSDDHARALYADPARKDAFAALFRACHLLFVGFDPAEEDLARILAPVSSPGDEQAPRHFALVPAPSATPHRQKTLEQAGVRLLLFEPTDATVSEEVQLLRALAARAGIPLPPEPETPLEKHAPSAPRPPPLEPPPEPPRRAWILAVGAALAALIYLGARTLTQLADAVAVQPTGSSSERPLAPLPPSTPITAPTTADAPVPSGPVTRPLVPPKPSAPKRDGAAIDTAAASVSPPSPSIAAPSTVTAGDATCQGTRCSLSLGGGALSDTVVRVYLDAPQSTAVLQGVQPICTLDQPGGRFCARSDKAATVPLTPPIRWRLYP
jgi:putative intracellular protease/amidase